jgi:hypothetical protein
MKILELDGKRYKLVEISEEPKRKTGYERNENGTYYSTGTSGELLAVSDRKWLADSCAYNAATYYTDKQLAKDNIRADALMRNLRRFSAEGRTQKIDWADRVTRKYYILFCYVLNVLKPGYVYNERDASGVYFDTKELAEEAIEKYRDELMWYFTEYQDTAEFREDETQ